MTTAQTSTYTLHNVLIGNDPDNSNIAFDIWGYGVTIIAENLTADAATFVAWEEDPGSIFLTNSIVLGSVDYSGDVSTNSVVIDPSGAVFQTIGGGAYYLTNNSPYRNAGTTNISSELLAEHRLQHLRRSGAAVQHGLVLWVIIHSDQPASIQLRHRVGGDTAGVHGGQHHELRL